MSVHQRDLYVRDGARQHGTLLQTSDWVLMHVGVVQASTLLQASLLMELKQMRSSTMTECTERWTARRRLLQALQNVKTTISRCPLSGRWQPTTPIHDTSSARTAGEQTLWLLQVDVDTIPCLLRGLCGPIQACTRLGQRT